MSHPMDALRRAYGLPPEEVTKPTLETLSEFKRCYTCGREVSYAYGLPPLCKDCNRWWRK